MRKQENAEETDWQRVSELLQEADGVPDAPDCRDAVMARILRRSTGTRWIWAGACAVTVVAAALAGMTLFSPRPNPDRLQRTAEVSIKQAPVQQSIYKKAAERKNTNRIAHVIPHIRQRTYETAVVNPQPIRRHVVPTHRIWIAQPVQKQASAEPEPTPTAPRTPTPQVNDADRPVALAIVTWPSKADQTQTSRDYSYVEHDATTGQTTECRIKQSGDSVDIYMESKPEAKELPRKGSIDYETKSRV